MILKRIFKKWEEYGLDWSGSGWGEGVGYCECSNERSGWMKCGILTASLGIMLLSRRIVLHWVSWFVGWFVISSHFGPNNLHSPISPGLYKMSATHLTVFSTQINRSTRRHSPEHCGLTLKSGFFSSRNLMVTTTQNDRYVAVCVFCVSVILFVYLRYNLCVCNLICVSAI
jgi:hypothetical protein